MGPNDPMRPLGADPSRLLDVRNVSKRFTSGRGARREEFDALLDVSLTVGEGECLGVVGESGSGKTTLARILSGLIAADGGGAYFEGGSCRRRRSSKAVSCGDGSRSCSRIRSRRSIHGARSPTP